MSHNYQLYSSSIGHFSGLNAFLLLFLFSFLSYHLSRCQGFEVSMETYGKTDTIGGPFLTHGQQSAGASSEDITENNIDKGHSNTLSELNVE